MSVRIKLNDKVSTDITKNYDIYNDDNKQVGCLVTAEDSASEYIFGCQIHIYPEYQRQGLAKQVINEFVSSCNKPFRFCIATNSQSAINFWKWFLNQTNFSKKHIRSEIWELRNN